MIVERTDNEILPSDTENKICPGREIISLLRALHSAWYVVNSYCLLNE